MNGKQRVMPADGPRIEVRPLSRRDLLKTGAMALAGAGLYKTTANAGATNPLGFCPITGRVGDMLNLFGPDFGVHLPDLCVRLSNDTQMGFTLPTGFDSDELLTKIVSAPPGMQPANFEVVRGEGYQDMPTNMPPQLTLTEPIYSWMGNGGARYTSFQQFSFPWSVEAGRCFSYWGGLDGMGRLSADLIVPFDENCCPACPPGTRMTLRAYGTISGNGFEFCYQATLINTVTLFASHIADALCALFVSAFDSNFGITMACTQTPIDPTRINITIGTPDASPLIDGGIHIELNHESGSIDCDSVANSAPGSLARSMAGSTPGSMPGSMPGSTPGSVPGSIPDDCSSIGPSCPSIFVDFFPFIFA